MLLTIGIPTYNRAENVSHLLHQLLAEPAFESVEILVIDDGGDDGTYAKLSRDPVIAARVRILKNDINLGYARTFARIFAACHTEYLMLMADDDQVVVENLSPLLDYLRRERPAFVSPQFLLGLTIQRGRIATGRIAPREFLSSSAHASGLVYRVEDCRVGLNELAERTDSNHVDALVYPQVVVVMRLLLAAAKCHWFALPTVAAGANKPSGLRDGDGRAYWSVESRWQQLKSFDALLTQYAAWDTTGVGQEMLGAQRERVFRLMATAMRSDDPALGAAFDSAAQKFYQRQSPAKVRNLRLVKWIARQRSAIRRFVKPHDEAS